MEKAKVYFTDFRTKPNVSLTEKLQKLCRRAGIAEIPFEEKFTAIKMHFGELGNLAFLRPNYAKAVADLVKELGGKPFLTDCNTLYPGSRKNALDHLYNAEVNGFNSMTTGCYVIIADITYVDKRNGKVLLERKGMQAETTFLTQNDLLTGQKNAAPRIAQEFARQIVNDAVALPFVRSSKGTGAVEGVQK